MILLPPTLLMGATIPLSSEAGQRQLGGQNARLIQLLVVVNTSGAVLGAYGASAWLLPALGQRATLLLAAACNAGRGIGDRSVVRREAGGFCSQFIRE